MYQAGAPYSGTPVGPMSKVTLSVSANDLRDRDSMSKSDPVCILYVKESGSDKYFELGRTEQIKDSINPVWINKFEIDYRFEERQMLRFSIYDWDTKSNKVSDQDHLGTAECSLGEVMAHQGSQYKATLKGGGILLVCGEEVSTCKEVATMTFSGKDLDKKDFLGKSDPFLVFYRLTEANVPMAAHKTEVIKNTLNPTWKPMVIPVRNLCSGDEDRNIKIECFDMDSDGAHDVIGECFTSLKTLKLGSGPNTVLPLINNKKKERKSRYKDSGKLVLQNISFHTERTFLDYIQSGCQLHFTVAVDFTASNGYPSQPNSLHFRTQGADNQYSTAIKAVGEIIQDYDSDKMFPALGFGARIPPAGQVMNEFFLNGRNDSPYVQGIQGILDAYYHSLNTFELYGPTNFSPVINHVMQFARNVQDGNNYFILLIITDGVITDFEKTKRALVEASSLPMSVIIVGVGNADFGAMEALDGDEGRLSAGGVYAQRDIVQFVELNKFLSKSSSYPVKEALAKAVLKEVPTQFLAHMKSFHQHRAA